MKKERKRIKTLIKVNESVIGDSIELVVERLMEGEGEGAIEDRDLVYNDNETDLVNPITNIRSDKFELMLEEKISEQEFKNRKTMRVIDEPTDDDGASDGGDPTEVAK